MAPQDGKGFEAISDFLPALGTPAKAGLGRLLIDLWALNGRCSEATSDFLPALGTPETGGVMQPHCPFVGPQDSRGYVANCDFLIALGSCRHVQDMVNAAH